MHPIDRGEVKTSFWQQLNEAKQRLGCKLGIHTPDGDWGGGRYGAHIMCNCVYCKKTFSSRRYRVSQKIFDVLISIVLFMIGGYATFLYAIHST